MADIYLAIAIAGANTLIVMGVGYRIRYHLKRRIRGQFTLSVGTLFHSAQLAS